MTSTAASRRVLCASWYRVSTTTALRVCSVPSRTTVTAVTSPASSRTQWAAVMTRAVSTIGVPEQAELPWTRTTISATSPSSTCGLFRSSSASATVGCRDGPEGRHGGDEDRREGDSDAVTPDCTHAHERLPSRPTSTEASLKNRSRPSSGPGFWAPFLPNGQLGARSARCCQDWRPEAGFVVGIRRLSRS